MYDVQSINKFMKYRLLNKVKNLVGNTSETDVCWTCTIFLSKLGRQLSFALLNNLRNWVIWTEQTNLTSGFSFNSLSNNMLLYGGIIIIMSIHKFILNYRYNKLAREVRQVAKKISELDASDAFRNECSARLLQKL